MLCAAPATHTSRILLATRAPRTHPAAQWLRLCALHLAEVNHSQMRDLWKHIAKGGLWRIQVDGRYVCNDGDYFVMHAELFSAFSLEPYNMASASHRANSSSTRPVVVLTHNSRPLSVSGSAALESGRPRSSLGWLTTLRAARTRFILHQVAGGGAKEDFAFTFRVAGDDSMCLSLASGNASTVYSEENRTTPDSSLVPLVATSRSCDSWRTVFRLQPLASVRAQIGRVPVRPFGARLREAAIDVGGRRVVVASYSNIARIDIGAVSWRWLNASGVNKLMLLDMDGRTCAAARRVQQTVHIVCAREPDLSLSAQLQGKDGNGLGKGLAGAVSGAYRKMLLWKLRLIQLVLQANFDVLLLDVDVLVLSPELLPAFVLPTERIDLVISSDARTLSTLGNGDCPYSTLASHRQVSSSWVCAGLMYMRATDASRWFIVEAQKLMEEFGLTDQDAIQTLLTGGVQISRPNMKPKLLKDEAPSLAGSWMAKGYRNVWSRAMAWDSLGNRSTRSLFFEWLTERRAGRTPRMNPQSAPPIFTGRLRREYTAEKARRGFVAKSLRVSVAANGPIVHDGWDTRFGTSTRMSTDSVLSAHFNCNTKRLMLRDRNATSWLFHPKPQAVTFSERTQAIDRRQWYSPLRALSGADVGDLHLY